MQIQGEQNRTKKAVNPQWDLKKKSWEYLKKMLGIKATAIPAVLAM